MDLGLDGGGGGGENLRGGREKLIGDRGRGSTGAGGRGGGVKSMERLSQNWSWVVCKHTVDNASYTEWTMFCIV